MSREHDVVTLSGVEYDALLSEAEEAARLREELAALRAAAAEAALRESEANRILLDALVAELKAEKQPTLGRFATLLRRATTKVNRAALQGGDGDAD